MLSKEVTQGSAHLVETQDAIPSSMVFVIHLCIQCINKNSEKATAYWNDESIISHQVKGMNTIKNTGKQIETKRVCSISIDA